MKPPLVLAMLHLPPPVHGGTLVNQRLVESVVARRFRLRVIPLRFTRELGDLGRPSARKLLVGIVALARQVWTLLVRPIDAGYLSLTLEGAGLLRDVLYMHAFRLFRVPYVVHVHTLGLSDRSGELPGPARRALERALAGAARIVACSGAQRDEIAAVAGVRAGTVEAVPNGLPDLPPHEPRRRPDPRPTVLFLSNLRAEKGVFTLLEAMPHLVDVVPDVRFIVAGPWDDGAAERRFLDGLEDAGLEDRVRLTGAVDEAEKRALLARAHVFVFPSHRDNLPGAVIEALRQGIPVVASRTGGVPEMLQGGAGLLVPPGDAPALAREAARVLQQPPLARDLAAAGRARYEERFRIDRWGERMAAVIGAAAGRAANGTAPVPRPRTGR